VVASLLSFSFCVPRKHLWQAEQAWSIQLASPSLLAGWTLALIAMLFTAGPSSTKFPSIAQALLQHRCREALQHHSCWLLGLAERCVGRFLCERGPKLRR
jgi:hypothetical protein